MDATTVLAPGESARLGAYTVTHHDLIREPLASDPRVFETRAEIDVSGPQAGRISPALRDYPNSVTPIATPTVMTSATEDFYVTLLAYDPDSGAITLRLFKPAGDLDLGRWGGRGRRRRVRLWPGRRPAPVPAAEPAVVVADA